MPKPFKCPDREGEPIARANKIPTEKGNLMGRLENCCGIHSIYFIYFIFLVIET